MWNSSCNGWEVDRGKGGARLNSADFGVVLEWRRGGESRKKADLVRDSSPPPEAASDRGDKEAGDQKVFEFFRTNFL